MKDFENDLIYYPNPDPVKEPRFILNSVDELEKSEKSTSSTFCILSAACIGNVGIILISIIITSVHTTNCLPILTPVLLTHLIILFSFLCLTRDISIESNLL